MHFATLARFVARTAGVAVLKKGATLYLTIGILSAIVFARQGLDASTVVAIAQQPHVRVPMLMAWTVLTLPVARAIFATPETWFLRALPVSTLEISVILGVMLAAVELPWFILWTRGGGIVQGLGATLIAMALHGHFTSGTRPSWGVALTAMSQAAWLSPYHYGWLIAGGIAVPRAIVVSWRNAPELARSRGFSFRRSSPLVALASAHAVSLVRGHAALLVRALILAFFCMGWASLAIANNDAWRDDAHLRASILLAVWAPVGVFIAATPMRALLEAEDKATWVLDACAVLRTTRRLATALLVVGVSAPVAAVAGASVGTVWRLDLSSRLGLAARLSVAQMLLAVVTEACARYATRGDGRDSARLIVVLLVVIGLAEGALALLR